VAVHASTTLRASWLERLAPLGGIVFAILILISFFTSEDYGNMPQSVVAYANSSEGEVWLAAVTALLTPLLLGLIVAGLLARLSAARPILRPAATYLALGDFGWVAIGTAGVSLALMIRRRVGGRPSSWGSSRPARAGSASHSVSSRSPPSPR
jgi:hypothetical protein